MIVIDHTSPRWQNRRVRTNGAETYSADLVKYQIPFWQHVLPENSIVSTCPKFYETDIRGNFDVAVQYLHTYPKRPLTYVRRILREMPFKANRVVFLTAYKEYETRLRTGGFDAHFVPMSIDVQAVQSHIRTNDRDLTSIIWFGNAKGKRPIFRQVRALAQRKLFNFEHISGSRFRGEHVTQAQSWEILSRYKYAVAVGRCALEAYALGLQVIIAGRAVGGIVRNDVHRARQINTNFNARYATFSYDLGRCFKRLPSSQIVDPLDIREMVHPALVKW